MKTERIAVLYTQAGRAMKRSVQSIAMILGILLMAQAFAWAHSSYITISSPTDGQIIETDTLPITLNVEGIIMHSNPSNVSGMPACMSLDGGTPDCIAALEGLGNVPSYTYTVPVSISTEGWHTLQAFTYKGSPGDHAGSSEVITIKVVLVAATCDEMDPPAYANHYMNILELPAVFAQLRGKVIRQIANNHADGKYGTCLFDYDTVEDDVCAALAELDSPICPAASE